MLIVNKIFHKDKSVERNHHEPPYGQEQLQVLLWPPKELEWLQQIKQTTQTFIVLVDKSHSV